MDTELTIIDGDVLEDTFENIDGLFDRFSHVLICNMIGELDCVVPYIYARHILYVQNNITVVPVDTHPEQVHNSIKGELLEVRSRTPKILCSLIERQQGMITTFYDELIELRAIGSLDERSITSLAIRLGTFLKTMKVGNYSGNSIIWLPENYDNDFEIIDQGPYEEYEDFIRRTICSHIKCRRLPMAHILPVHPQTLNMLRELLFSIEPYKELNSAVGNSHFVMVLRDYPSITNAALKTFMAEEFRCVKNDQPIDADSMFIFEDKHLDIYGDTVVSHVARENLEYYVGDYLNKLDLSFSFITGSAITASIIRTYSERHLKSRANMIDVLYPKVLTILKPEDIKQLRRDNINLWDIRAISEKEGIMTKGKNVIRFDLHVGSDVDIAVDNTVTNEHYDSIAKDHLNVIQRYYPYVKMRQYAKPKGDWNYVIYTDDPLYIPVFRTVEIYRSSFRNICSHHVGAVRGCYTSRWSSDSPKFYLTASALWTSKFSATPNYHYFAGRKSNPQDIIIKNIQRGIGISDMELSRIINLYMKSTETIISHFPFYEGNNVPYSVFSANIEYEFVRVDIIPEKYKKAAKREPKRDKRVG